MIDAAPGEDAAAQLDQLAGQGEARHFLIAPDGAIHQVADIMDTARTAAGRVDDTTVAVQLLLSKSDTGPQVGSSPRQIQALGAAYPESGGKNKSALHWDMVCDLRKGGRIEVDGKVISKNGRFLNAAWPKPIGK